MKCPVCSTRKGKRACPALETSICPSCCGEHRLGKISCPEDCPHLQGEFYQLERRTERARGRGKRFLASLDQTFPDEAMRQLAWHIHADICWWTDRFGSRTNAELADDLEAAARGESRIVLPGSRRGELAPFLVAIAGTSPRYQALREKHGLDAEQERGTFNRLANRCRRHGPASEATFLESAGSFFDELELEADLDYSPLEELGAHEIAAELRARLEASSKPDERDEFRLRIQGRSSSGLILP